MGCFTHCTESCQALAREISSHSISVRSLRTLRLSASGAILAFVLAVIWCNSSLGDEKKEREWARWKKNYVEKVLPVIEKKCVQCHNKENPEGEFDLSKFPDGESAVGGGDIWDRVAVRVRLNEMPPPRSPGLSDPEKGAFHQWVDSRPNQDLCNQIASDETQSWYRGHVMSRRLTRFEYANAVRDMTGVAPPADLLPPEDGGGGEGFDTVGDSLFTSPIHLEAYLRVTDFAVGKLFRSKNLVEVQQALAEATGSKIIVLPPSSNEAPGESINDAGESQAVTDSLKNFARLAWRRPVTDSEIEKLKSLYDQEKSLSKSFEKGLEQAFKGVLLSPHFLFVSEPEPEKSGVQRLTPHQFAMRMSLVLWSSVPDAALLQLADDGSLYDPDVIRVQIHRMLADNRSRAIGENFGLQWLGLRDFLQVKPDAEVFPEYDADLSRSALEETIRFVSGVFREDRPLTDLLDSDYVYADKRLAEFYGLPWNDGLSTDWDKIPLPSDSRNRGGVATMASVLVKTSYPRRTSPVLRGRWILEDILGSKVPPPPPNVPALEEASHGDKDLTLRQRLEVHRQKAECASCHDRMDPLGFGLENFDAIGRWRNEESGQPIDSEGTLPSGEKFHGAGELKKVLLGRKDEFYRHVSRKMTGFAFGRELNKFDQCIIDKSVERLHKENRATVLLEEILMSYGFQHRYYSTSRNK